MAMAVQWSTLPGDILIAITKILNTDTDLLRLCSVCSNWRSSLPPPRKLFSFPLKVPSLRPLADWFSGNGDNGYFVLNQSTVYRLSPPEYGACAGDASDGWLFKVSETSANTFSLQVPFSAEKIKYAIDTGDYDFQNLIFFDEKCYAISQTGVLVFIDSELNLTEVESTSVTMGWQPNHQNYLVECKSELYVVSKISDPEPEFYFDYAEEWPVVDTSSINIPLKIKIFKKFDDWDYVCNLGYMVLFLGDDVSFGVSAEDFDGFKGNCVFLTDECFYDEGVGSVYGVDTGVYDLDLRSVK